MSNTIKWHLKHQEHSVNNKTLFLVIWLSMLFISAFKADRKKTCFLHHLLLGKSLSILLKDSFKCKSYASTSLWIIIWGHSEQCSLCFLPHQSITYTSQYDKPFISINGFKRGFVQAECCHFIHSATTMTFLYFLSLGTKQSYY